VSKCDSVGYFKFICTLAHNHLSFVSTQMCHRNQ